jgi:putative hemolysin
MQEVSLKKIIEDKKPGLLSKYPTFIKNPILWWIEKVFRVKKINAFIRKSTNHFGNDFIDLLFQDLNSTLRYSADELSNIPKEGPVVIVANHPLGALDGLGIVRIVSKVRPDVKIVVNDILSHLTNLNELFLPVDIYSSKSQRANLMNITKHIKSGKAIIFFPAGIVSRMKNFQVQDKKWTKGAAGFARKFRAPIVCAKIQNRNSLLFYFLTKLKDEIAPFLFPREMFNFVGKELKVKFGKAINASIFEDIKNDNDLTLELRNYVYSLDKPSEQIKKHFQR